MQDRLCVNARSQFRKMDQAFNAILNACKRTKGGNLRDDTCDHLPGYIALFHCRPGINLGAFDGERNFLLLFIDAKYLHLDLLADMQNFTGMVHTTPSKLANMNQAV